MRKLVMRMSFSVEGFVGGPNGENDWVFKSSSEESRNWMLEKFWEAGLIIMGRNSFEMMAPYWPTAPGPFAAPMNEIPKAVFTQQKGYKVSPSSSSTPAAKSWTEARVFDGDLGKGIMQLKQTAGNPIIAIGGAGFMRSLVSAGLIDEYLMAVHPAILGAGLPVFNGLVKPIDLKLVATKDFPGGIVVHTYHPA